MKLESSFSFIRSGSLSHGIDFPSSTRCLQASRDQLIWSTKPWHSRYLLKNWRFNRKCTEIGLRYGNRIWGITLNPLLQVYRKLPYPIPVALGIRYRTCSVFNNGYGTVPADTSKCKHGLFRAVRSTENTLVPVLAEYSNECSYS